MDFRESAEHTVLRDTVRQLGESYGHEYFYGKAKSGEHVTELWDELCKYGLAGVNIPEEYGGGGGSLYDLMIVAEELGAAGCPLMTLVVSPTVCGPTLAQFGTEEQKQKWLTGIGTGEQRMAFAITEPDAGSNSHNIRTRAALESDGWHLTGEKYYISGVDDATTTLVVAKTGQDDNGRARISCFVVENDRPNLIVEPLPTMVIAAERQFTMTFDDVVIPEDNLIGEEGGGLKQLFVGLNPERIMSSAICSGIGRYAMGKATRYAKERTVWKQPIGAHQGIAHPLARAHLKLESARLMMRNAAALHTLGVPCGAESNMAKFTAAEAAEACLDAAVQTLGGNGLSEEFGVADLWGLTRLYGIAPVSREMILNYVGQHLLGLPKSY